MHKMKERIQAIIEESIKTKRTIPLDAILQVAEKIIHAYQQGGKILVCGNGGSAADAQHMAGEFVNRFKQERRPWPCLALTTDTSILTAISNDYSYDQVFSKQVEAYGQKDDILIGISTSGNSKNIIKAVEVAKKRGILTICFLGRGGILKEICDLPLSVNSSDTPRIQESHILMMHIITELVEEVLVHQNS